MKPFDIEAAKQGKPVVTRDGRDVRIICFDLLNYDMPILGLIKEQEIEVANSFYTNGKHGSGLYKNTDLFMKEVLVERWVNLYPNNDFLFKSEEDADNDSYSTSRQRIACVKITIQEDLL